MLESMEDFLTFSQTTNLSVFQTDKYADDNFKFEENGGKFYKKVENAVGKG